MSIAKPLSSRSCMSASAPNDPTRFLAGVARRV
jgi:hypothetical protein